MKVGTYTRLSAPLLGCALLWTSAACGSRTSLLLEEDAGVTSDTPAQESNTGNSGGRAGSTTGQAGRSAAAGAGGMTGRTMTAGRGGRAGRGGAAGERADEERPRAGSGGRTAPRDRDAAADSGENEEQPSAGSGGEPAAGSGGEPAGGAGAGGEAEPAAGSGGSDAGPVDAGMPEQPPEGDRLTALSSEQITEICDRIESATANQQWTEAATGWCSRGALGTPECPASQQSCVEMSIIPICTQTVPDCPDITIEEFVVCRTDALLSFVEYNRTITCDTAPGLPSEQDPSSCIGPYQRCAPLAALKR